MVDRQERGQMIATLHSYMDEQITAFEFELVMDKIKSPDQTVKDIKAALYWFIDDNTDHKVIATKEDWDYLNRLLLLLQSDCALKILKTKWRWDVQQFVALTCLFLFTAVAYWTGVAAPLFIAFICFGLLSKLLATLNSRITMKRERVEYAIVPFPSFTSLLTIRRSVPKFSRHRFPVLLQNRHKHRPIHDWIMWVISLPCWIIFSPITLLFQALPVSTVETRIELRG